MSKWSVPACIALHTKLWSPDGGSNVVFNKYNNTDILASMLPVYHELLQTDRLRVLVYRYSHPTSSLGRVSKVDLTECSIKLKIYHLRITVVHLKAWTVVQTVGFRPGYQVRWNNKCWKSCSIPSWLRGDSQFVVAVEILMEECQQPAHGNGLPSLDLLFVSHGTPGFMEDPEKQRREEDRYLLNPSPKCQSTVYNALQK